MCLARILQRFPSILFNVPARSRNQTHEFAIVMCSTLHEHWKGCGKSFESRFIHTVMVLSLARVGSTSQPPVLPRMVSLNRALHSECPNSDHFRVYVWPEKHCTRSNDPKPEIYQSSKLPQLRGFSHQPCFPKSPITSRIDAVSPPLPAPDLSVQRDQQAVSMIHNRRQILRGGAPHQRYPQEGLGPVRNRSFPVDHPPGLAWPLGNHGEAPSTNLWLVLTFVPGAGLCPHPRTPGHYIYPSRSPKVKSRSGVTPACTRWLLASLILFHREFIVSLHQLSLIAQQNPQRGSEGKLHNPKYTRDRLDRGI